MNNNNNNMFLSVFKNVLLIFILILILHFLIKNKLSDVSSKMKRQMIIKDTLKGTFYKKPLLVNKSDNTIESTIESVEVTNEQKDDLYGVTDSGSGLISKEIVEKELVNKSTSNQEHFVQDKIGAQDECNKIPCDAFLKKSSEKESKIKALYDFVFTQEKTDDEDLNKYFPKNVVDQVNYDKNEVDKHFDNTKLTQEISSYKYEVIGNIKEELIDGIEGIDSMEMSNYSNL